MKPASKTTKLFLFGGIIAFFVVFLSVLASGDHVFQKLPILGPKEIILNDKGEVDTLYHTVPDFTFTNHKGQRFSSDSVAGKILVVDFFFTRCGSICPKMTRQMKRLDWLLEDPKFDDVVLLSHTVDPHFDNAEILAQYRKKYEASDQWIFLTGDKEALYEQGVKGYYLTAQEDALEPGGFLHSEKFVLVDPKRRIRGFYDGTNVDEVSMLEKEIKLLIKELNEEKQASAAN